MIGVAVVGYGWWGRHVATRLKAMADFDLVCVAEPDEAARREIAQDGFMSCASLEDALREPRVEAVILTSPNTFHDAQVAQAAAAGRHVLCEKPLSLTPDGARRSVAACRDAGVVLGIGHERRFEPGIVALKDMLEREAFGTVMHAELAFSHDKLIGLPGGTWRTSNEAAPAAGMTQMGIHLTDLLIWFFGPVARLHAITASRSLGWETGDLVTVQMQFAAGMTATLQAVLHTPLFIRTHVFGTTRHVEIRNDTHPDTTGGQTRMVVSGDKHEVRAFDWTDSVAANLEAFAAAIRGDARYPFRDAELVHNIEVLDAIVRSVTTGEAVTL